MTHLSDADAPSSRLRRRRRTAVTLTVVVLLLGGVFLYAAAYVQGWAGSSPHAAASACPTPTGPLAPTPPPHTVSPEDVTVNIYNTTGRQGLARSTATELRDRGYLIATVSNDPMHRSVPGVAEIRYGTSGAEAAKLASALVPGATLQRDGRPDSSVDLVLGRTFRGVAPALATAPASPDC